jgi:hypothetical protein
MADSTGTPPPSGGSSERVDPITGFWRDVWARTAAQGAGGMPPFPGAMGVGQAMPFDPAAFMSPDAMKRMQAAFFEAMAQSAEQSMRSPQFLEAMKRSMDQAMRMRRQMDDFLQSNMASAFDAATGGANAEVLGAIRLLSKQMDERFADLSARVSALEAEPSPAPTRSSTKPAPAKSAPKATATPKKKR